MKLILYKTMHHFFPDFLNWLQTIKDPRDQKKIDYPINNLIWIGILLFLMKLESLRQIKFWFNNDNFINNLEILSKSNVDKVAHPGTLSYLLERIKPEHISVVRVKMLSRLIRMRCLDNFRLQGYYLIAIDGTGHLVFNTRHCEHCLVKRKKDGEVIYYYHNVLEAKLVTNNGLAISIETEFIENMDEKATKQDCELKAFYRLVVKIKKHFPQLNICLLLDALYAGKPVFDICKDYYWKYMITFKEGSMPATYAEYNALKLLQSENVAKVKVDDIVQKYNWVTELDYEGRLLNVLECNELKPCKGKIENTKFVWLTNFNVNEYNFKEIGKGGRLRWKTENEGFNTQKNGGYNLEHVYSSHYVAVKNFYFLLQIAHTINQLMEKGSLLKDQIHKVFGSIRNIARKLLEDFRIKSVEPEQIQKLLSTPFQIRFDSC